MLDTWFSSALWPFATLGWPEDTEDLRAFYPGDLNTTARDIIRLWENRMIFSGLELMGDIPFTDVVIHSTVHAPTGGRMSKSLGTGMNPIAVIEAYGADAMRYGLMKMASSQDVRFSEGAIDEGRKLANKLWNVARLILLASEAATPAERPRMLEPAGANVVDQWSGNRTLFHAALADEGCLVASFDNSGTPSPKGRAWRKSIYGDIGVLASKQQAAALRSLAASRPWVDLSRVAVWGWSGGGSRR